MPKKSDLLIPSSLHSFPRSYCALSSLSMCYIRSVQVQLSALVPFLNLNKFLVFHPDRLLRFKCNFHTVFLHKRICSQLEDSCAGAQSTAIKSNVRRQYLSVEVQSLSTKIIRGHNAVQRARKGVARQHPRPLVCGAAGGSVWSASSATTHNQMASPP